MPTQLPDEHRLREPGSMELDPSGEGVAVEETVRLIASNKVEGTPVFNARGGPRHSAGEDPFSDPAYGEKVDDHYA